MPYATRKTADSSEDETSTEDRIIFTRVSNHPQDDGMQEQIINDVISKMLYQGSSRNVNFTKQTHREDPYYDRLEESGPADPEYMRDIIPVESTNSITN